MMSRTNIVGIVGTNPLAAECGADIRPPRAWRRLRGKRLMALRVTLKYRKPIMLMKDKSLTLSFNRNKIQF